MNQYKLLATLCLLVASNALAATLVAEINPQTHLASTVDGTRLYQDSSTLGPVATIVGVATNKMEFTAPTDGKCHNYWATNYNKTGESPKSNPVVWCPPNTDYPPVGQPPVTVGGFKITTKVEPLP